MSNSEAHEAWVAGWDECGAEAIGNILRPFGDEADSEVEHIAASVGVDVETMWSFLEKNGGGVLAWGSVEATDDDAEAARAVVRWLIERAARRYLANQRNLSKGAKRLEEWIG